MAGRSPKTIILNEPGSLFEPRWNELDINFRKNFRVGRHVLTGELGLYNMLNASAILGNDRLGWHIARDRHANVGWTDSPNRGWLWNARW